MEELGEQLFATDFFLLRFYRTEFIENLYYLKAEQLKEKDIKMWTTKNIIWENTRVLLKKNKKLEISAKRKIWGLFSMHCYQL